MPLHVAVVGCGLIGRRRAAQVEAHPDSDLAYVADTSLAAAQSVAEGTLCAVTHDWRTVVDSPNVDVVIVATPNAFLHDIAIAALEKGKHVLIEKPMGRNAAEAQSIASAATRSSRLLKIGFNHRYHPALDLAHQLVTEGTIGTIINVRARYGHGGRPGYEKEWRGNPQLAGGGELTDQGVHIVDLIHWFAGIPEEAFAFVQSAVWPIAPLEDNAFGLFRFPSGAVASFHTSWTQWKNLFSFEIFGDRGSLSIEGLGGSYGIETLITNIRQPSGGAPDSTKQSFDGPDRSWELEWRDFVSAILRGTPYLGTPNDGLAAMQMLDALYASARSSTSCRI